jgi:hypothetical protein
MKDSPASMRSGAAMVHGMTNNGLCSAWWHFVRFCEELQHGEIEKLKIQDGLPILAEVTKKKVKFTG